MPIVIVNGVNLNFEEYGSGEPAVLIAGGGARARVWRLQVEALTAAGYRCVTFDNRGVPPSDVGPEGFTLDDMAADTAGLIEVLGIAPCRVVGFSLGGMIAQELILAYPHLVTQAVLIATRGRTDALRAAIPAAEAEWLERGQAFPHYEAFVRATQNLSPRTQNDKEKINDWLSIFEMSPLDVTVSRAQLGVAAIGNRLEQYRKIKTQCLAIGFHDDLICPPHLCRELAEYIPDCRYEEIAECGHYGYLEDAAAVNSLIINFFQRTSL